MAVVVVGSSADRVAIDHAWLIDKDSTAHLQVEPAFGYRRHCAAADAVGVGGNFEAVTNAGDRFSRGKEMPSDPNQVLVVAKVFRRPSTRIHGPGALPAFDIP